MLKRFAIAFAILCSLASAGAAGDPFETPVTGEVLKGWERADGTRIAGLRLRMAPGWKTYWRQPGDAGIPPQFDWSGSDNLGAVGITWPTPKIFLTAGMRTIGYTGDVVLPIALVPRKPGEPIRLNAEIDMGVCSDICVPHRMTLDAVIDDRNTKPVPAIAAALAEQPYSGTDAGVTAATCALRPTRDGLAITARLSMPSAGGAEIVVIEPGEPGIWVSETATSRGGGTLTAEAEMIAGAGKTLAIDRSALRFTVLGEKHAVDIRGCAAE